MMAVDQFDQEQLGGFITQQWEQLGNQKVITPVTDRFRTFDRLAELFDQLLLLPAQGVRQMVGVNKEKIVADRVTLKKNGIEGYRTGGIFTETDRTTFIGVGAVHDQAVDDIRLGKIGRGQIHTEHVFAKTAAVTLVADSDR